MVRLYNVTKVYPNGVKALVDVTLTVDPGEFVFVVGPSGAGKTTLIRLISREEFPTRGQIIFNGKNIGRFKSREVALFRRQVGMVFQDYRLLPGKTVFENVALAMEITGKPWREIKKRVPEVLSQVGLLSKIRCFPYQLSGGEQQRVSLARALVNRPSLLMADEPTGNLDAENARELIRLLLEINREGTTVLMATHALDIVNVLQKRVVTLREGCLAESETQGSYRYGT
ncbi:MAG: cell division ATP-binding protein FtsE [Bacillota bacterium]